MTRSHLTMKSSCLRSTGDDHAHRSRRDTDVTRPSLKPGSLLENSVQEPQGLKPSYINTTLIAALKALRHPKSSFSANR